MTAAQRDARIAAATAAGRLLICRAVKDVACAGCGEGIGIGDTIWVNHAGRLYCSLECTDDLPEATDL